MRTVGIIAEYNPFHTGHEYHIRRAKELSGADYAVVIMSPDFVQRGENAVFDKYTRARMALMGGADLVIELPVCYATGSAEYFARGAVALLDGLHVADALCFGGESDDLRLFYETARILLLEPDAYTQGLKRLLKSGKTYPSARSEALQQFFFKDSLPEANYPRTENASLASPPDDSLRITGEFLSSPNNILGIEYCKALLQMDSSISALPVRRRGSEYNSTDLEGAYCSATALRRGICQGISGESLLRYIPENCHSLFEEARSNPRAFDSFMPCLTAKMLSRDSYSHILDIGQDLSDRIRNLRFSCVGKSFDEIVALLKTKQMTEARIRRALLHLLLNIDKASVENFLGNGTVFYARVLGFKRDAAPLLHLLKQQSAVPLISKSTQALDFTNPYAKQMWQQDVFASHLYRALTGGSGNAPFRSEYEISPVVI